MSYTTKHKPYKLKSIKCNGCGWSISHCIELEKGEKMKELQNIDGFNAKVYGTVENPLFLAKDIAELIEHSRASEMLKIVDDDEKLMQPILVSGQNRNMWFLTEDGLYEVLMSSKKPQAKIFKKKVKEILKTIRKHGAYMTDAKVQDVISGNGLADLLLQAGNQIKQLELEKSQMKPKALFADSVSRFSFEI